MRWARERLDSLLRRIGAGGATVPLEPVRIRAIGVVRNNVSEPRPDGWERVRSDIAFREDLIEALDGIEGYSHVIVVFAYHLVPEEDRVTGPLRPRDDERPAGGGGVLATRSQLRPSGIGVSVVPLVRRRKNLLRVMGLDAVNGTPVLDIKPYLPPHDSVPEARMPDWVQALFDQRAGQDG